MKENYKKSSAIIERKATARPTSGNNLTGKGKTGVGDNFSFVIKPSFNELTPLREGYFHVNGTFKLKSDGLGIDTDRISWNAQPLFTLFSSVVLSIGETEIESITEPALYAMMKQALMEDFRDLDAGTRDIYGQINKGATAENYCPINTSRIVTKFKNAEDKEIVLPFTQFIPLTALFNAIPKTPIFGHEIHIKLTRNSSVIPCANVLYGKRILGDDGKLIPAPTGSLILQEFSRFDLVVPSYKISSAFQTALKKIYSSPKTEIISYADIQTNTMDSTKAGTNATINKYYRLGFESKFLTVFLGKEDGNNMRVKDGVPITEQGQKDDGTDVGDNNKFIDKALTAGTPLYARSAMNNNTPPMAHKYIPIYDYKVYIGNELIYDRNMAKSNLEFPIAGTRGICQEMAYKQSGGNGSYYDALPEYENFLSCRTYYGKSRIGAPSYEDFISKYYGLYIPTHAFTTLATGTEIRVEITYPTWDPVLDPFLRNKDISIKSAMVFNLNSKALIFENGLCTTKNITEDQKNDLDVVDN